VAAVQEGRNRQHDDHRAFHCLHAHCVCA
jgi:hypothetical protein